LLLQLTLVHLLTSLAAEFANDDYRQLWIQLLEQMDAYNACRLMVEALIAAQQDKEQAVVAFIRLNTSRHLLTCSAAPSS